MQQSSAKRLEERIKSASAEKDKLESELMALQSELKSGKKAMQGLESDNSKLSGESVTPPPPPLSDAILYTIILCYLEWILSIKDTHRTT